MARNEIAKPLVVFVGYRPSGICVGGLDTLFTRSDLTIGLRSSAIIDPVQLDQLPGMILEADFRLPSLARLGIKAGGLTTV